MYFIIQYNDKLQKSVYQGQEILNRWTQSYWDRCMYRLDLRPQTLLL